MHALKPRHTIIVLAVLLVLALAGAAYFYQQAHQDVKDIPRKELEQVVANVGRLMVLPSDEQPTLATVSDPQKLKDQAFFANAQKGDQVLIYMRTHKAILYRPSANKIIEVAPVSAATGGTNTPTQ
jgi:uncharacterized membrane protein affecting hemolysin expression